MSQHPSERYCPRFGQLAVRLGHVTPEQLKQALSEQVDDNLAGRPHRILGTIFFEHGWMSPGQIEEVLNLMFDQIKEESGP
ncbi:MAG: hypothetical protein D6751_07065 [Deltaproteobacteria bacterium]|nr:MAG: hypothetical protein D6751_07065 [Deltaproteobacteria bacterium]